MIADSRAGVGNPYFIQKLGNGKIGFQNMGKMGMMEKKGFKDGFSKDGKDGFRMARSQLVGSLRIFRVLQFFEISTILQLFLF